MTNSGQNSMANYASSVKIDNILNILNSGSNLQNQGSSDTIDVDAEENFSIAHCEEHPSRRRLVQTNMEV